MLIFVHKQLRAKICLIINFSSGSFPTRELQKNEGKTEQTNKQTSAQNFCNKDKMVVDQYPLEPFRRSFGQISAVVSLKASGFQEALLEKRT